MKKVLPLLCVCFLVACKGPQVSEIRLNQLGFAPLCEKTATLDVEDMSVSPVDVCILDANGQTIWSGKAGASMLNPISGKVRQIVDFSDLTEVGNYTLKVNGATVDFAISERPYQELTRKALRAFYYQRASMDIVEPYAEGYPRIGGHPDNHILVHPSAASANRPEGTILSCPGGWYDAGDYNKYIVNSGYTMGVYLITYEQHKAYFDSLALNIPESGNMVPDMLDEAMYNIEWMLTMQDLDGGVYHKLTEPAFEGFISPTECQKERYVVMKTTEASLDFAATMALAARIYKPFESAFPGFCSKAEKAAREAYRWAKNNPDIHYDQDAMNLSYQPAITTGAYDDSIATDEFYWAATELYLLSGQEEFKQEALAACPGQYTPATWGDVAELASLEWMLHPTLAPDHAQKKRQELLDYLQPFIEEATTISVHRSPYGNREEDFFWGCNSEGCCWRGIECAYAYHFTGEETYLTNAQRCLNHILGQNAMGYCYVTGMGHKNTEHPHHRLSYTQPEGTLPGFLAGGPNRLQQDASEVNYPKGVSADESYLDEQPSYASNEVTINWNVTLFALSAALDTKDF